MTIDGVFRVETGFFEPRFPKTVFQGGYGSRGGGEAGTRERAFARWCNRGGHLGIRTVDLIQYLAGDRKAFPKFSKRILKEIWRYRTRKPARVLRGGVWELTDHGGRRQMHGAELRNWVRHWYPLPGRWDMYLTRHRRDYAFGRARFRSSKQFWDNCSPVVRRAFLRSRRHNKRAPETFPDYFVVFRGQHHAFVEVKGIRESVRPRQREVFPMLVKNAAVTVLLVRIEPPSRRLRWFRVGLSGIQRVSGPEVLAM